MLTPETRFSCEDDAKPLVMLAKGLPIRRTLEAIARMAAHLGVSSRAAILLPDEDKYILAAEVDVRPADRALLTKMAGVHNLESLVAFGVEHCADVRPLLTQAAELVGVLVIFDFPPAAERNRRSGNWTKFA